MSEESRREQVEVKVGPYRADGTFVGEVIRFRGEEIGEWTDFSGATSRDDRGVSYTLYRLPDGNYRVHEFEWSRWQGEESEAHLYPVKRASGGEIEEEDEEVYGGEARLVEYDAYTEEQARARWPHLFAAMGMPNVRDID